MRIALVIRWIEFGGAERVVTELANWWTQAGAKVRLLTFVTTADAYPVDPRVDRVSLEQTHRSTRAGRVAEMLWSVRGLRKRLLEFRPDVVVSFVEETNVFTLLATTGLDVPVVVANRAAPDALPFRRDLGLLRRKLYPRAAMLVTQTARGAAWFEKEGFDVPIRVIPNAVDERALGPVADSPPWPWPKEPGRIVLLSVGRITAQKGHSTLIEAFARLVKHRPQLRLALVGNGPLADSLQREAVARGLENEVHFFGWKTNVQDFFAHADIYVHPSRYEGFPNALLEAMAHGLPCIATDCPNGPREVITDRDDGVLVPVDDASTLASAIDGLIHDHARRRIIGGHARRVRERFSAEAVNQLWNDVVETVRSRK